MTREPDRNRAARREIAAASVVSPPDESQRSSIVMAVLVTAIHAIRRPRRKTWMAGTRPAAGPAMTANGNQVLELEHQARVP